MGARDSEEMLEAALAENRRLEAELERRGELIANCLRDNKNLAAGKFHAEARLAKVAEVVRDEWARGRVLPRMVGSEDQARVRAVRAVLADTGEEKGNE